MFNRAAGVDRPTQRRRSLRSRYDRLCRLALLRFRRTACKSMVGYFSLPIVSTNCAMPNRSTMTLRCGGTGGVAASDSMPCMTGQRVLEVFRNTTVASRVAFSYSDTQSRR
jgi:hypothetical protein